MKAVGERVLVFTLVCLLGCCLRIGAQGETADCCKFVKTEWKRCNGTCEPGYYEDGDSNVTEPCTTASTRGNGTTTIATTTTTATVSSPRTPNPTYLLCKPCADGCKNCSGSSINDCLECHDTHEYRTVNGSVTCAEKAKSDDIILIIVGASVGGVVFIVVVVLVIIFCCRRCRRRQRKSQLDGEREEGSGIFRTDADDEAESVTSTEAVDAERKVSPRKGLKEPNYVNLPKHAVRPFSIEKGHDKVLRYTRDPTLKKGNHATVGRSESEESELEHLPPAPKPPSKIKNPPREVYEIVETELQQAPAAAPQEVYVDVDNSKPKPNPKPKPKPKPNPKPKPGKAPAEPEPSPQPTYEPIGLPKGLPKPKGKQERNKTTKAGGHHGHKGGRRKTEGSYPNQGGSLPNPASPVSCPELPKFPIEQASVKKKKQLKPKSFPQSPPSVNDDDESDPEEGYENAPKKKKEPHHKNGQNIPNTDDDDSDPEADYENAPKDKGPLAARDPGKIQPHGRDNPAADMELEDPQEVYGNQDVIDHDVVDKGRQAGRGHRNTNGRTAAARAAEADSDPGDDHEEVTDPKAASNTNMEEDDDQPIYGNEISDEESPEQPYQNVSFISTMKS